MRKVLALSLGVLLVAGSAFAQEPAEVPLFFAVGIPAGGAIGRVSDAAVWSVRSSGRRLRRDELDVSAFFA